MWDPIVWWFGALTLMLASFWLSYIFVGMVGGGGILAILIVIFNIFSPILKKLSNKEFISYYIGKSKIVNSFFLLILLILFFKNTLNGNIDGKTIHKFLTAPAFVLLWSAVTIGMVLQAATNFSTGQKIGLGTANAGFFVTIPLFFTIIYLPFLGKENFIFWGACVGVFFGTIDSLIGNFIILRKRQFEAKLDVLDDDVLKKLEPLAKWIDIIRYIPRFSSVRRDIAYLWKIRNDAWRSATSGQFHEAELHYEVFDFEYPRIHERMTFDLEENFHDELILQLDEQSNRALILAKKVENQNLKAAILDVRTEIEVSSKELRAKEDWKVQSDLQNESDRILRYFSRLDRLVSLDTIGSWPTNSIQWGVDENDAHEYVAIAEKLNISNNLLKQQLEYFSDKVSLMKALEFDSSHAIVQAIKSVEETAKKCRSELENLKRNVADKYRTHIHGNQIVWIAPKIAKSGEEVRALIIVRETAHCSHANPLEVELLVLEYLLVELTSNLTKLTLTQLLPISYLLYLHQNEHLFSFKLLKILKTETINNLLTTCMCPQQCLTWFKTAVL